MDEEVGERRTTWNHKKDFHVEFELVLIIM